MTRCITTYDADVRPAIRCFRCLRVRNDGRRSRHVHRSETRNGTYGSRLRIKNTSSNHFMYHGAVDCFLEFEKSARTDNRHGLILQTIISTFARYATVIILPTRPRKFISRHSVFFYRPRKFTSHVHVQTLHVVNIFLPLENAEASAIERETIQQRKHVPKR